MDIKIEKKENWGKGRRVKKVYQVSYKIFYIYRIFVIWITNVVTYYI